MSMWIPKVPVTVSLRRLFPSASFVGCADIHVSDATERSTDCGPSALFAAIPGTHVDGINFVDDAIGRGAPALLVDRPLPNASVPQCIVSDVRSAFAQLCAALWGHPSRRLKIAGVTGTNGKTTVTWLIRSILQQVHERVGVLGTIEYHDGVNSVRAGLTTPDTKTMSRWLASMLCRDTTHAAIELSSHALSQGRTIGTQLDAAVVTNITQDHFDYHDGYDDYLAAKARVFEHCAAGSLVVLNADDPGSISLRDKAPDHVEIVTFGLNGPADISATILQETECGTRFEFAIGSDIVSVWTPLAGRHNVSNSLAAAAIASHFGISATDIAAGIEALTAVPGRLERIDCGQPFDVFVDYAHTDDALQRCIEHLQQLAEKRVICVFGAGGDRDRSKRPLLGAAAAGADLAIVTSDNPRTEDPLAIIQDILEGFPETGAAPHVELDRYQAIRWALQQAEAGDIVLVAGKGHETEQIIGTQRHPFDDREVVRETLRELMAPQLQHQRIGA